MSMRIDPSIKPLGGCSSRADRVTFEIIHEHAIRIEDLKLRDADVSGLGIAGGVTEVARTWTLKAQERDFDIARPTERLLDSETYRKMIEVTNDGRGSISVLRAEKSLHRRNFPTKPLR